MSDVVELLDELSRLRVDISVIDGRLKARAPKGLLDADMNAVIRMNRDLLVWAVRSWPTHGWARCDRCGQCRIVPTERRHQHRWRCVLTPGCAGRTVPTTKWKPAGA